VPISSLSGGNQQKLVVGRELEPLPAAIVAENPTRGLDIRATAAVHERLRTARDAGCAVVLYSSDIDELLELADRVFVMHAGRLSPAPATREGVARAMLGAAIA
jgi:simple sugar transport system ATP-binding protein